MQLTDHLNMLVHNRLEQRRIVVWYDGELAFGDFVATLRLPQTRVVTTGASAVTARRAAEVIYRAMQRSTNLAEAQANLLIYVPRPRNVVSEARARDPFEVFAAVGCAFGDKESEQLHSLATQATPELGDRIDRMFREGRPTFAVLDRLALGASYPLLRQALGTSSAQEVAVLLLGDPASVAKIDAVAGCRTELLSMLGAELGFAPFSSTEEWESLCRGLAQYLLLSELAFDLPVPMPDALANHLRAGADHRVQVFAICERLRDGASLRERYIELATAIEHRLGLSGLFQGVTQLGVRDTFPFGEKQYLVALTAAIQDNDLATARRIVGERSASIWRELPERIQLWRLAERCLDLLEIAGQVQQAWTAGAASLRGMVEAYAAPESGWWRLDRAQRHMEQGATLCSDHDLLDPVLARCRSQYRSVVDAMQERFLQLVRQQGWAPEGVARQDALFDRTLAPALHAREKVAYVLVDSLRYEMGYDLTRALATLGEVTLQPVAALRWPSTPSPLAFRATRRRWSPQKGSAFLWMAAAIFTVG